MTDTKNRLTRPIVGIENRTAQEVFDIMCDRIEADLSGTREAVEPVGGWVMVPRKPTDEMLSAVWTLMHCNGRNIAEVCYESLISVAPAPPSDPVGQGAVTDLAKRLRAATMRFDWTDIPDDEPVPAIPLLREAANVLSALSPAPEAGSDEVERLRAERDSLLKGHRILNVSGAKLETEITALRDQLGKMREALTLAEERFAQIDCAVINQTYTTPIALLNHCKALASAGFSEVSRARATLANTNKDA